MRLEDLPETLTDSQINAYLRRNSSRGGITQHLLDVEHESDDAREVLAIRRQQLRFEYRNALALVRGLQTTEARR